MAIVADGQRVDEIVNERGWGDNDPSTKWFYGYIENCFDPLRFLVAGDDFGDAYDWFLCDRYVEEMLKVDIEDPYFVRDYAYGTDCLPQEIYAHWSDWKQGIGVTWRVDAVLSEIAEYKEAAVKVANYCLDKGRLTMNDNGEILDTESVQLREVRKLSISFDKEY